MAGHGATRPCRIASMQGGQTGCQHASSGSETSRLRIDVSYPPRMSASRAASRDQCSQQTSGRNLIPGFLALGARVS